jgi:VanZ family protein
MMLGLLDAPSLAECINFCGFGVAMPALVRRLFLEIESRNHLSGISFGACIVILALAALLPADIVVRSELPAKLEHFVAYSGTAVVCGFAVSKKRHLIGWYLLLVFWAGGLEAAQRFSPGRHAAVSDFAVSTLGVICGGAAWWLAKRAAVSDPAIGRPSEA